jgi:hypothetical protein
VDCEFALSRCEQGIAQSRLPHHSCLVARASGYGVFEELFLFKGGFAAGKHFYDKWLIQF